MAAPATPTPRLTQASIALTQSVEVIDERGHRRTIRVPAERDLTLYVDRTEVVTLMTLGAHPEWLVIGYLLNQRLVGSIADIESVTVDWDAASAAVYTRNGMAAGSDKSARRVVTTGCGQGSMFAHLLDAIEPLDEHTSKLSQRTLARIVDTVRQIDTLYKEAGSVHACALFEGETLRIFIEDVGRHNALDSIAGWRALQQPDHTPTAGRAGSDVDRSTACPVLYTTGRLTSEMIIKAAQMGVPVVVSRSGTTEMAIDVALRAGVCAIGRALNQRFLCFTNPWRVQFDTAHDHETSAPRRAAPGSREQIDPVGPS
jgi:FdhD protein